MAKQKQEQTAPVDTPAAQLTLVNFDDIESIEVEETTPAPSEPVQSETAPVETEAQVLATVETFDSAFGADPLKADYLAFGNEARELTDPADATPRWVGLGMLCHNLMVKERNLAPGAYERAKVIKKCEHALRLCNVPESLVRPNEIVGVYWLAKLDRSKPGAEGEARTFSADETPADWYGGNVTMATLRIMAKCIDRVSGKKELDLYEYKEGYEAHMREWLTRLREGYLSKRSVETLIDYRRTTLANERKAHKYQGLNADEIASIEAAEKNQSLQSKLNELGSKALDLQKMAAEELKKNGADLRDFLANKGIIPPASFPTPAEIAARMTPGDAKALVQELIKQYVTKPDRINVFKALRNTCNAVVAQIKSVQETATKKTA